MRRFAAGPHTFKGPFGSHDYVCFTCRSKQVANSIAGRQSTRQRTSFSSRGYSQSKQPKSVARKLKTSRISSSGVGDSNSNGQIGEGHDGGDESVATTEDSKIGGSPAQRHLKTTKPPGKGSLAPRGRNENAKVFLRELLAKDQLGKQHLDAALAATSRHKNPYDPRTSSGRVGDDFQRKLEHNVAASAALSKFKVASADTSNSSSGRLLRELSKMHDRMNRSQKISDEDIASLDDLTISPKLHPKLSKIQQSMARKPATPPKEGLTDFERRLLINPYANILASEVRMCTATGARMPKALLASFTLKADPHSGLPWMVPDGYDTNGEDRNHDTGKDTEFSPFDLTPRQDFSTSTHGATVSRNTKPAAADFSIPEVDTEERFEDVAETTNARQLSNRYETGQSKNVQKLLVPSKTGAQAPSSSSTKQKAIDITGSRAHIIATLSSMKCLSKSKGLDARFMPLRWRAKLKKATSDLVVRDRMDEHLKRLMSYNVARKLAWLQATHRSSLIPIPDLRMLTPESESTKELKRFKTNLQRSETVAAVLWFDDCSGEQPTESGGDYNIGQHRLARNQLNGDKRGNVCSSASTQVPLYEMQSLLGEEELGWLRKSSRDSAAEVNVFRGHAVIIKAHEYATEILTDLWKLEEFISPGEADHKSCLVDASSAA